MLPSYCFGNERIARQFQIACDMSPTTTRPLFPRNHTHKSTQTLLQFVSENLHYASSLMYDSIFEAAFKHMLQMVVAI